MAKEMSEITERSRVSGLIDADGSFGVYILKENYKYVRKNKSVRVYNGYKVITVIQLQAKPKTLPEELFKLYGGNLNPWTRKRGLSSGKFWRWSVTSREQFFSIIKEIEPFLTLKKAKAQEILKNEALLKSYGSKSYSEKPKEIDDLAERLKKF